MNKIFNYSKTILETHLDTFGHVNNATYLQIYEEARWDIITAGGFGLAQILELQQGPTILDVTMTFKKELRLRQTLLIQTQFVSYERKIGVLKQWIQDESNQICSDAVFKVGLFDLKARKLILPTPLWIKAIGVEETGSKNL